MAQFAQGLGFDLANAFAGHTERLANLLERPLRAVLDSKTHPDDLLFPRTERSQHVGSPLLSVYVEERLRGRDLRLIFDEVAEVGISFLTDRRLQRDRRPHDLSHLANLSLGNVHLLGDLRRGGFASQALDQLPRDANQLVHDLDHVHRQPNGARLIGNRPADGLPNPPGGIRGELVSAAIVKFVYRLHQANVPLLDQVEKLKPTVAVLFRPDPRGERWLD